MLGLGRLRRPFADPRLRPRHHLSPHRAAGRRVRRAASRSGPTIISTGSRAGSPRRSASRPRPARSTTSTRGSAPRARRACWSSRSTRSSAISASEAWTWEHMALCRARPVFGSPASARTSAGDDRRHPAHAARPRRKVVADAAKMRAEMERHKPPQSALDVKLGPGGLVDLEFAIHVLQLTTHVGLDTRLEVALEALAARIFGSGKYCRCAKVAVAHAGDDAAGRAGRRQADCRNLAAGRRGVRRGELGRAACRARRGAAEHRASCGTASSKRHDMINEGDKAPAIDGDRERRQQRQPRRAGPAAGALFLSQGRHVGLHPRGAGLHRAAPAISPRPASRSSASRATR